MSVEDLLYGLAELDEATDDYAEAARYYEGRAEEFFSSTRIRRLVAATGERYKFNLAKTPVNVLANRVQLAAVSVAADVTATDRIAEIRAGNDMDNVEPEIHLRTFEFGDAYAMVWPVEDDDPDTSADDELAAVGVQVVYHSPLCVRVVYDPEHQQRKAYAVKRWRLEDKRWRVDVYYPDTIERWVSTSPTATDVASGWVEWFDPEDPDGEWPLVNPTGAVPFFHFRTALPYGVPEHRDAYGPQDAINKMLITQLTTSDSHGWPQRYALTDKGAELDQAGDDPDWDDDEDADDDIQVQGGVGSGLRTGPGTLLALNGMRGVGQFDAADPAVFTDPVSLYVNLMAQTTSTPAYEFDMSAEKPSGESRRLADAPLSAKVGNRQRLLTGTWRELWVYALSLVGVTVSDVDIRWAPQPAIQDADWWNVAAQKRGMGIPQRQICLEAGYSAEQLDAWGITETTTQQPNQRIPARTGADADST
jgi:hypothetical protein